MLKKVVLIETGGSRDKVSLEPKSVYRFVERRISVLI